MRRPVLVPFLLGLAVLALYLVTGSSDLRHNGDTDLRYQTTQAMVDSHQLWIADPMWRDTRVARGRGGHLYAFYGPGQALLMVPLYVLGKAGAHHLSLPYDIATLYASRSLDLFLGALLVLLFYAMARAVGYSVRVSVLLSLIFGLATPAWPDAQSSLEQTQVDLFLLLAVYGVWRFISGGMLARRWLLLAGAAAGAGVLTRYDAVLYVPILGLFLAWLRFRASARAALVRDWIAYGAAVAPFALGVALWNFARFGSPWQTGLHEQTFGEPPWAGFLGLTVSPGKGLLWYLPIVWLLPLVARQYYRRMPSLALLSVLLVTIPLLFYSAILYWHGDPAWGPRYLYTSLPYLVLPLGLLLERWSTRPLSLRLLAGTLVLLSLAIQVSAVSVNQWRFWYRLEAMEEYTSQPFRWGARFYHYYWNVTQSPIIMQFENVYQVVRLDALGEDQYRLTARPTRCQPTRCWSNPADNYPINTLSFWWADTRHPLLGARTRGAIAAALGAVAVLSLVWLGISLRPPGARSRRVSADIGFSPAESTG